jgi:hypothetical protein
MPDLWVHPTWTDRGDAEEDNEATIEATESGRAADLTALVLGTGAIGDMVGGKRLEVHLLVWTSIVSSYSLFRTPS